MWAPHYEADKKQQYFLKLLQFLFVLRKFREFIKMFCFYLKLAVHWSFFVNWTLWITLYKRHLLTLYCPCTHCAPNLLCTEHIQAIIGTDTPTHICFRNQRNKCSHLAIFWRKFMTIFKEEKKPRVSHSNFRWFAQ